jgi:hypothetical protein
MIEKPTPFHREISKLSVWNTILQLYVRLELQKEHAFQSCSWSRMNAFILLQQQL